jgi:hypothetical protein
MLSELSHRWRKVATHKSLEKTHSDTHELIFGDNLFSIEYNFRRKRWEFCGDIRGDIVYHDFDSRQKAFDAAEAMILPLYRFWKSHQRTDIALPESLADQLLEAEDMARYWRKGSQSVDPRGVRQIRCFKYGEMFGFVEIEAGGWEWGLCRDNNDGVGRQVENRI